MSAKLLAKRFDETRRKPLLTYWDLDLNRNSDLSEVEKGSGSEEVEKDLGSDWEKLV